MIYLDSCAIVKLIVPEAESTELIGYLTTAHQPWVTSALARVEVVRAVRHLGEQAVKSADVVLTKFDQLAMTDKRLDAAGRTGHGVLRSLDAIHLASAQSLESILTTFVSYDKRLLVAAKEAKLPVAAPGTDI